MVRARQRAFTLIELMIVVAIVGVLAALATYGVRRYLYAAKTAEARNSVGQMTKDTVVAFNRESMSSNTLQPGTDSPVVHSLCASSPTPVPDAIAKVQGKKYQSAASEWRAGSPTTGFHCMRFAISDPQYYQYNYQADAVAGGFTAIAYGDLDANTTTSSFRMFGQVVSGALFVAPNMDVVAPDE